MVLVVPQLNLRSFTYLNHIHYLKTCKHLFLVCFWVVPVNIQVLHLVLCLEVVPVGAGRGRKSKMLGTDSQNVCSRDMCPTLACSLQHVKYIVKCWKIIFSKDETKHNRDYWMDYWNNSIKKKILEG